MDFPRILGFFIYTRASTKQIVHAKIPGSISVFEQSNAPIEGTN